MPPVAALCHLFPPPTKIQISPPPSSSIPCTTLSLSFSSALRRHTITITATSTPIPSLIFHQLALDLDEAEAESLLHKHPDIALAPPESLRHRIASLQSIGITGPALHRTLAKRPDILTSTPVGPFLDFAGQYLPDLRPAKLERLLVSTSPLLLAGFSAGVHLLLDRGLPAQNLGQLLDTGVDIRKVFCERPLRELEEMVLFLQPYGWPDLILRRPRILNLDLHSQMIPRIQFLSALGGGDEAAVAVLIRKLPGILAYTVDHLRSHVEFWRSSGLSDEQVFKIALVYPNMFSVSRERKLVPRVEFLRQCGLSAEDVFKFFVKAPLFISLSFKGNLAKKLALLVKIGYRHRTRELALAMGATTRTSCENMQAVMGVLFGYGLSSEDLLAMSKKHPQVLQYNHESLEKKVEFLVEGMERDVGELLVFPAFLGYKLDDRIKRRYEAKIMTRGKGMSLNKLLSVADERFSLLDDGNAVESTSSLVTEQCS